MDNKNPLLAGLFNVLLPGAGHLYVNRNWLKFALFFTGSVVLVVIVMVLGRNIETLRDYTLPPGVCTGVLIFLIAVFLFNNGMREARIRNERIDSAAHYRAMRTLKSRWSMAGNVEERLARLEQQREQGLISEMTYEARKARLLAKKK